ncbi:alpha/beta-hydrolase [Lojkania enalia]|uniref:Alpha/beta-hydrolase n=1 Tax=Lojkania enalia TaxID=147567 RepID=A0A9P4NDA7_9PLEO|nr:alpha/beta-hydrolase [Didymosphaeria enalia]
MLSAFNLMEQYASAAYCGNNFNSPGDKITCSSGSCPLVESATTNSLAEFSKGNTDVTGFVALDNTNRQIIVSFRGSSSIENWMANLDIKAVNTDICSGCSAHSGFWRSWSQARDEVLQAVKNACAANPGYSVATTGHSLGGAIATLAAAQLRNEGYTVALYTFGAPRIASSKLSDYITKQPGGNYRITHWNDPVPRLPPLAMSYVHISPEYYIEKTNLKSVTSGDIKVYDGSVNIFKGNGAWLVTDVAAHLWYFNRIAGCAVKELLGGRGA